MADHRFNHNHDSRLQDTKILPTKSSFLSCFRVTFFSDVCPSTVLQFCICSFSCVLYCSPSSFSPITQMAFLPPVLCVSFFSFSDSLLSCSSFNSLLFWSLSGIALLASLFYFPISYGQLYTPAPDPPLLRQLCFLPVLSFIFSLFLTFSPSCTYFWCSCGVLPSLFLIPLAPTWLACLFFWESVTTHILSPI